MSTSQTAIYDAWVKEALDVDPSRYARQSSGLPSGKASSGPDLMLEVTSAQDTLEQQLAFYHTTKTGAQSTADLTGNVDDPGPKIDKAAAEAHKDAAAAIASIKGRDPAKAAKLISAIKDRVKEISGLATNYATAVDKANAAGAAKMTADGQSQDDSSAEREAEINTPWGKLRILALQAKDVAPFVLRLSALPESDKLYLAKYQAALKEQQDAVKPMATYLSAPAKMEDEIKQAASEEAAQEADVANVGKAVASLKDLFNDNLLSQIENAKIQWQAAQKELDSADLKDQAAELRAQAEEEEKQLDFASDLFKAGIELLANPEEGAANAAAEAFTGAIKYFWKSDFAEKAEKAEKQAGELHRDSVTDVLERAKKATDELNAQIKKIGPLSDDLAGSIQRSVGRGTKHYDTIDCAKPANRNCKFRFNVLQETILKVVPLAQFTRKAADERYRNVWAGADALLNILTMNLGKYDKDNQYGHTRTHDLGDQALGWNRDVLSAIRTYIDSHAHECYQQAQGSGDIMASLLSLSKRAFAALKKAAPGYAT